MIIALFPNSAKLNARHLVLGIYEFLISKGVQVFVRDEEAPFIHASPLSAVDLNLIDFFISIGGDGTILKLVHTYPHVEKPILGINLGGLGFMADVPLADVYPSLQDLLLGEFVIEKRWMLEGETSSQEKSFAVNDIVLHRAQNRGLIDMAIHIDGLYVNTFSADGMILSTSNGSTAYSLAAGGPIVMPTLEALVITPVCAHTISNRPIVVNAHQELKIQYLSEEPIEATFDGIANFQMKAGDILRAKKCSRYFSCVNLFRTDYFSTLRTKLGWVGRLRH